MTALPTVEEVRSRRLLPLNDGTAFSLYTTHVLSAQNAANGPGNEMELMYSRVIGYLFLYAPSDTARGELKTAIASCNNNPDPFRFLYHLGEYYLKNLIMIFRKHRGRTPAPSEHPSRPSLDLLKEETMKNLRPSPRNHSEAKISALVRDNWRCMVSGRVDSVSVRSGLTVIHRLHETVTSTQCCHIFPDSLGNVDAGTSGNAEPHAARVWGILRRFGYKDVYEELKAANSETNFHRLENIMTLNPDVHDFFDKMMLWFEEVKGEGTQDCYRVVLAPEFCNQDLRIPDRIQFISHNGFPLPNPRYLEIHAACCRVAHLSGAAKFLDTIFRDMEELTVLSQDGASADVLVYALHLADPV